MPAPSVCTLFDNEKGGSRRPRDHFSRDPRPQIQNAHAMSAAKDPKSRGEARVAGLKGVCMGRRRTRKTF